MAKKLLWVLAVVCWLGGTLGCENDVDKGDTDTTTNIESSGNCELEDGSTVPVGWEDIDTRCDWGCGCGCLADDELVCTDCACGDDTSV